MSEIYMKSLIALKEYDSKPSIKEWTKIAKEFNLMSSKTMCLISGLNWNQLCHQVRRKNVLL